MTFEITTLEALNCQEALSRLVRKEIRGRDSTRLGRIAQRLAQESNPLLSKRNELITKYGKNNKIDGTSPNWVVFCQELIEAGQDVIKVDIDPLKRSDFDDVSVSFEDLEICKKFILEV